MYSSRHSSFSLILARFMSASTSSGERLKFSIENAYTVMHFTPSFKHISRVFQSQCKQSIFGYSIAGQDKRTHFSQCLKSSVVTFFDLLVPLTCIPTISIHHETDVLRHWARRKDTQESSRKVIHSKTRHVDCNSRVTFSSRPFHTCVPHLNRMSNSGELQSESDPGTSVDPLAEFEASFSSDRVLVRHETEA